MYKCTTRNPCPYAVASWPHQIAAGRVAVTRQECFIAEIHPWWYEVCLEFVFCTTRNLSGGSCADQQAEPIPKLAEHLDGSQHRRADGIVPWPFRLPLSGALCRGSKVTSTWTTLPLNL